MNLSIYRMDHKNAGDWFATPKRYLPLRATQECDIGRPQDFPNRPGVYVVAGGIGRPGFSEFLAALTRSDRQYKLLAWGVGGDSFEDRKSPLAMPPDGGDLLDFYQDFDRVGTRIWNENLGSGKHKDFRWVPCPSCLHPKIEELRNRVPTERLGIYEHYRVPLAHILTGRNRHLAKVSPWRPPVASNRGLNIVAKFEFMSRFEFIVTNSYHGVYWATLLGRRVICLPFKDGFFSIRHKPIFGSKESIPEAMEKAVAYPEAYDQCRSANLDFYAEARRDFGDI